MRKLLFLMAAAIGVAGAAIGRQPALFVPVLTTDFPDAFVLPSGNEFFAYATNATGHRANVQMARSTNLVDWQPLRDSARLHDAMPVLPPWARPGYTWAPEVIATEGGYALHFTAKDRRTGLQCLGAAFSTDPRGPFVSQAGEPIVCQKALGGSIDSSPFHDSDGKLYLYYKNDGNAVGKPASLWAQRLAPDALSVLGEPVELLRSTRKSWEEDVVEAPTMARMEGRYLLFFSGGYYGWPADSNLSPYAIGYATCGSPVGPCAEAPENPILHSYADAGAGCLSGPGHQSVFEAAGRRFISFHAWSADSQCHPANSGRYLYVAPLLWRGGKVQVGLSLRPAP